MKHLGDITKISGLTAPIVDCIIGGSPCQDLSVAGKRAGLEGERSGLFMEQIRIIKEMREQDVRSGRSGVDIRPRYGIYENVPGAFSSNKGEDFRIVLEELAKVADKDAVIPMPQSGKWTTSGCIVGDGWSISWRVLDAQFWGVPQRRRRIALVADFGGESAPEILFVRKSLSGHTEPSQSKRKEAASDATRSLGADDSEGRGQVGIDLYNTDITGDKAATLGINCGMSHGRNGVMAYTMQDREGKDGGGKGALIAEELSATQVLMEAYQHHGYRESDVCGTLTSGQNNGVRGDTPLVCCYGIGSYDSNAWKSKNPHSGVYEADTARTLDANNCGYPACNQGGTAVVEEVRPQGINGDKEGTLDSSYYKGCGMRSGVEREVVAVDCRNATEDSVNGALQSNSAHSLNGNNVVRTRYIVRRLTPLECERLQGFPDGWTDIGEYTDTKGKKGKASDAARYKALGNSIALPSWKWVLKRLCACYERDATMASLFDGIGGFPLLWEQINGNGACLWASEIEEFPIAVTKARIGE